MKEVNGQTFAMMNILEKHILRLQKEVSELKESRQPLPVEKVRIHTHNRFQHLQNENEENIYMYDDDARGEITNSYPAVNNNRIEEIKATQTPKRPQVIVKNNPEREPYFKKTVPGNANYADITKEGKKTCIIGASIVKRIRMWEFNKYLEKGGAIKRSFSGATTKKLNYYIEEVLNEENIDRIIINIGANNITNQNQSEKEIFMEIMDLVIKCHNYGVNEVFVSGVTLNPNHQSQIRVLNGLLRENTGMYNYVFIDNSDIEEEHLWKEQLHLNNKGTNRLACHFLDCLNEGKHFNSFY